MVTWHSSGPVARPLFSKLDKDPKPPVILAQKQQNYPSAGHYVEGALIVSGCYELKTESRLWIFNIAPVLGVGKMIWGRTKAKTEFLFLWYSGDLNCRIRFKIIRETMELIGTESVKKVNITLLQIFIQFYKIQKAFQLEDTSISWRYLSDTGCLWFC